MFAAFFHFDLWSISTNEKRSASPLNAEAAELWDSDMAEFKRKVIARHRDITDEEAGMGGL